MLDSIWGMHTQSVKIRIDKAQELPRPYKNIPAMVLVYFNDGIYKSKDQISMSKLF
jgi:hypothetical protein